MKQWQKSLTTIFVGFAAVVLISGGLLLLFVIPTDEIENSLPFMRARMIKPVLEWGRLAPFPKTALDFTIVTEGNSFTRAFRAEFEAGPKAIATWIAASPGLRESEIERPSPDVRLFRIKPGGGATLAEVEINDRTGHVKVYVAWS
jgi:hypothetical protein